MFDLESLSEAEDRLCELLGESSEAPSTNEESRREVVEAPAEPRCPFSGR